MTFDQLRVFVAVAETLNMRRAGELLHLTQSAVSMTIAALESRHRTHLFDRVGRGLELSAAGRSFLPEAKAVLSRAADAERVLQDLAGLASGEVRIAASQTVATYWLPARIAAFAKAHPSISISLKDGNSADAVAAVLSGEADLGFVEGAVQSDLARVQTVGSDRLGLYAAPGHPLAGRPLRAAELRAAVWVFREAGSGTRDHLEGVLAGLGLRLADLNIRLVLPSNEAILESIGAGEMIAAVSELAARSRLAAGSLIQLDCTLAAREFAVVTHRAKRLNRAVAAFLNEAVHPAPS